MCIDLFLFIVYIIRCYGFLPFTTLDVLISAFIEVYSDNVAFAVGKLEHKGEGLLTCFNCFLITHNNKDANFIKQILATPQPRHKNCIRVSSDCR